MCWACWLALAAMAGITLGGCGRPDATDRATTNNTPKSADATAPAPVKVEFPEGDPSVPAELGGPGFEGGGEWQTANPGPLGDPAAKPGGVFLSHLPFWPENLRMYGIGSNSYLNSIIGGLCYETLCSLHPETLETMPALASHWQISDDKLKFRFRINPKAHWSDGKPVVADDVVATYRLIMDDTLLDPMRKAIISVMKEPKVLSKYMFEVECKEKHWLNFLNFTRLEILPAHEIAGLTGKQYNDKYNFRYTAVSGPYIVLPGDVRKNESVTVTRRKDYWGNGLEMNRGLYNFDRIRLVLIGDDRLAMDKAVKGELDFYPVYTAKWWVEDIIGKDGESPHEQIRKGQLVAQKVFTRSPEGTQGCVFNTRKAPLDDVRVRKALAHLYDRKLLLKQFAYSEYTPLKSYFPGSDGENPDNQMVEYDPQQALELLKEAGYTQRGSDGILMRNGQKLSLTILYRTPGFGKYFTAYQEACRKVGVEIKLRLLDDTALMKALDERTFEMAGSALTGALFPDPRQQWTSQMADSIGSINYAGFKSPEADKIIARYSESFELKDRTALLRELDGIIFQAHPYMLDWYVPYQRMVYWNKFGMPKAVLPKYNDWRAVYSTWWFDPELAAQLAEARKSGQAMKSIPPREVRFWNQDAAPDPE